MKKSREAIVSDLRQVFTARVRSTTGRLCFDTCLSLSTGGYPYPIMLCNISQNAMGQTPGGGGGGYPARSSWRGTLPGEYPYRVPPGQVRTGGYPARGGTLPGGTQVGYPLPPTGYPPSQVRKGGVPS